MRALIINEVCGHTSTGKISADIAISLEKEGYEVKFAYGRDSYVPDEFKKYAVRIGNGTDVRIAALETRIFDNNGLANKKATRKFLKWATEFDPDLLWIHNLHGYFINYELLFDWIKSRIDMQVKWTLHDCWAMTGHCTHFSFVKCNRWQGGCFACPQKDRYPKSLLIDNSKSNYLRKKYAFTGVKNMQIITPSIWLKKLVEKSFLQEYPVEVINNKVDENIFHFRNSNFREKYKLQDKKILLGVANVWEDRKGLQVFYDLSSKLDDRYQIVLVGLNEKQMHSKPNNVIGILRTTNQIELAEIYSAADLFINPSVEETFGMTAVEAELCGTKSIVYADTACEEIAAQYNGIVVPQRNMDSLIEVIVKSTSDEAD